MDSVERSRTSRRRRGPQARDSRSERVHCTEKSRRMKPAADSPLPAVVGTVGIAPTPSTFQGDVQTDYTTFPWEKCPPSLFALRRDYLAIAFGFRKRRRVARTAGNAPASGRFGDGCLACRPRPCGSPHIQAKKETAAQVTRHRNPPSLYELWRDQRWRF